MGSFDVACGLSGLTIHEGDPIALTLLNKKIREPKAGFKLTQTKQTNYFTPAYPAIYGTYDDYGRISNIKESPITKAISAITTLSIEDSINHLDETKLSSNNTWLKLSNNPAFHSEEYNGYDYFLDINYEEFLTQLGFEKTAKNSYLLQNASYFQDTNLSIHIQGNTCEVIISGERKETKSYQRDLAHLTARNFYEGLFETTGIAPGFPQTQEMYQALQFFKNTHGMFIHADFLQESLVEFKKYLLTDTWIRNWDEETDYMRQGQWTEYIELKGKPYPSKTREESSMLMALEGHYREYIDFMVASLPNNPLVIDALKNAEPNYEEHYYLGELLRLNNRIWAPSFNGDQFGNEEFQLLMNNIRDRILTTRIAEWD